MKTKIPMAYSKLISVFDDRDCLNNVIPPLSLDVGEIFVVYHHDSDEKHFQYVNEVIKRYKPDLKINFRMLTDDEKELDEIFSQNPNMYVDVGGEKYLSMVLFDKAVRKDNIIIYYDNEENVIKEYRNHEVLVENVFKLKIEDIITLGGGSIISQMHRNIELNDFENKEAILSIMEESFETYQAFTSYIQKVNSVIQKSSCESRTLFGAEKDVCRKLKDDAQYLLFKKHGLLEIGEDTIRFKNVGIMKMFEVSGSFLENYIYLKLKESNYFDDVMMSCVIDFGSTLKWYQTICEIDCLLIKDNHLLFISCKSNKVSTADINEIKVHNTLFGNLLSAPVLCTLDDLNMKNPSVYSKGKELEVAIIDKTSFNNHTVSEEFLSIINNTYSYERLPD